MEKKERKKWEEWKLWKYTSAHIEIFFFCSFDNIVNAILYCIYVGTINSNLGKIIIKVHLNLFENFSFLKKEVNINNRSIINSKRHTDFDIPKILFLAATYIFGDASWSLDPIETACTGNASGKISLQRICIHSWWEETIIAIQKILRLIIYRNLIWNICDILFYCKATYLSIRFTNNNALVRIFSSEWKDFQTIIICCSNPKEINSVKLENVLWHSL